MVRLALKQFCLSVAAEHVLILTDNMTTKAHINRQGGTSSKSLMLEARRLGCWAERHLLSISVEHIAGVDNVRAYWLSCTKMDNAERQLLLDIFQVIVELFGQPKIDLFATSLNTQLPHFYSRFPLQAAEAVDALHCPWPQGLLYAFPPLPLIPRVI